MTSQEFLAVQMRCFKYLGFFLGSKRELFGKLFQWFQISCFILNLLLQSYFLVMKATEVIGLADDLGNVIRVFNSFVKLSSLWFANEKVAMLMNQINDMSLNLKKHHKIQKVKKLEGRIAIIYVTLAILIVTWVCVSPIIFSVVNVIIHGTYEFNLPIRSSFFDNNSSLIAYLLTYAMVACISYSTVLASVSVIRFYKIIKQIIFV